jgi:hypothetical protein
MRQLSPALTDMQVDEFIATASFGLIPPFHESWPTRAAPLCGEISPAIQMILRPGPSR